VIERMHRQQCQTAFAAWHVAIVRDLLDGHQRFSSAGILHPNKMPMQLAVRNTSNLKELV
jgi:hypothetical protein